ncbi:MAG: prevent-host-death family protein [Cyanobacteria bacterium P01_F01_bin.53]
MSKSFKQVPMSELRVKLPKLRRQVQSGRMRVVCTHYGEIAAFLLPLQDIEDINASEDAGIQHTEEMPLTEFRENLTESWEKLISELDCIYLTFHRRKVVAVVSPRFTNRLTIPLIGDASNFLKMLHPEINV